MLDLWLADIDTPIDLSLLDEQEAAEVARYRFEDDRRRAAMSRYMRRVILSKYTRLDPRVLRFQRGAEGKPALECGGSAAAFHFNITHSCNRVALAVAHHPVGIDIEGPRPISDARQLAARFFAPEEQHALAQAHDVHQAFFTIWTAKEAVIKAIGRGLAQALDSFVVHPQIGRFTPVQSDLPSLEGLNVQTFELDGGYRGAVAIRGEPDVSINWLC